MFTEKSANLILSQFHRKNGRLNGRYRGGLKIYCSSGTQMKPNVVSRFPQFLANLQVEVVVIVPRYISRVLHFTLHSDNQKIVE